MPDTLNVAKKADPPALDPAHKRQEEIAVSLALKADYFAKSAKEYRKGGFEGLAEIAGVKAMLYFEIASFVRQWTPPTAVPAPK